MPKPFPVPEPTKEAEAAWLADCLEYERDPANRITVGTGPMHKAVVGLIASLREDADRLAAELAKRREPERPGEPRLWILGMAHPDALLPVNSRGGDAIRVSTKRITRAGRIVSAVLRAAERRGFSVAVDSIGLQGYGAEIGIRVMEAATRKPKEGTIYGSETVGTGKLRLIGWRVPSGTSRELADAPDRPLEDQLNDFFGVVYRACVRSWQAGRESAIREAEYAQQRQRQEERERIALQAREERERLQAFREAVKDEAGRWAEAETIRAYVRHLQTLDQSPEMQAWARDALDAADALDPTRSRRKR